jgi:hypothetical protein
LIAACRKIQPVFPIIHISKWEDGACLSMKDPALLMTLRDHAIILVGFDRASMAMHAGTITREGVGHSGVILFRRLVSTIDYGRQARLLVELFNVSKDWDWADRIEYLPRQG